MGLEQLRSEDDMHDARKSSVLGVWEGVLRRGAVRDGLV